MGRPPHRATAQTPISGIGAVVANEAARSLARLLPRHESTFRRERDADPAGWDGFADRLGSHFERLFAPPRHLVFGYVRRGGARQLLALANVSDAARTVAANELRLYGLADDFTDLVTDATVAAVEDLVLDPYRFVWLSPR